jgi:hypothetical protein
VTEPFVIETVIQRNDGDCWAACLAMLLGLPYTRVVEGSRSRKYGMTPAGMVRAGKRLGFDIRRNSTGPTEDDEIGVLTLVRKCPKRKCHPRDGHVVMYLKGVLYNPGDGTIYTDVDTFLRERHWKIDGFMWRV